MLIILWFREVHHSMGVQYMTVADQRQVLSQARAIVTSPFTQAACLLRGSCKQAIGCMWTRTLIYMPE